MPHQGHCKSKWPQTVPYSCCFPLLFLLAWNMERGADTLTDWEIKGPRRKRIPNLMPPLHFHHNGLSLLVSSRGDCRGVLIALPAPVLAVSLLPLPTWSPGCVTPLLAVPPIVGENQTPHGSQPGPAWSATSPHLSDFILYFSLPSHSVGLPAVPRTDQVLCFAPAILSACITSESGTFPFMSLL